MNRDQNRVRISNPFLEPSIGTLPQDPKTGSHWVRVWKAEYRHDLHFGAPFATMKSGRGSKKQCQMQSDNLYDFMCISHVCNCSPKSRVVPARCMYACAHCRGSCGGRNPQEPTISTFHGKIGPAGTSPGFHGSHPGPSRVLFFLNRVAHPV